MAGKIFLVKNFLKMLHSTDGLSSAILVCWGVLVDNSGHPWSIKMTSDSALGEGPIERAGCWSKG